MKEHAYQLAEALNAILDEIVSRESKPEPALSSVIRPKSIFTLDEMQAHFEEGNDFLENPIGQSLRLGIQHIGEILAQMYGIKTMGEVSDLFESKTHGQWKIEIIDKWWDGITDKDGDTWVA